MHPVIFVRSMEIPDSPVEETAVLIYLLVPHHYVSLFCLHFTDNSLFHTENLVITAHLMQDAVQMLPVRIRNKYLSETVSATSLTICSTREASSLSKISSNNNKGTVLPVRFRKSNCANFNATRYVLFCPCEPSF